MILSTTLAAIGLFANSSPVIIGAMILAPLMGPIISMSMAIVRQDAQLLEGSISTLVTGLLLAMGFAALLSMIIPISQITPEIAARTQPNLLDLGVAIISGVAGAYAHARASIAKSLAGVAISVALVPTLAVTGIGIGWFNLDLIYGAFLLFLTNLSGILLASALTFLALGFAPFRRAKRGLTLSAIAVAIVSIPLAITFQGMIKKGRIQEQIERLTFEKVTLSNLTLKSTDPLVISAQLVSNETISDEERHMVKLRIEQQLGQPIVLESSSVLRLE